MPSPQHQKLLEQRDALLARAESVRRSDPKMASYLESRAGDMDSELEGVDPIKGRDEQGFEQGDDPDYIAFHGALDRIAGRDSGDSQAQSLSVSPGFQAALNKHLGEQLRQNWMQQMQPQGERFQSSGNAPAQFQPMYGAQAQPQKPPNVYGFMNDSAPPPIHQLSQLAALLQALQDR